MNGLLNSVSGDKNEVNGHLNDVSGAFNSVGGVNNFVQGEGNVVGGSLSVDDQQAIANKILAKMMERFGQRSWWWLYL